jgi:hypothetical protein
MLMAVGKHGKVDGGYDTMDGRLYGGAGVWADENGVGGLGLFMLGAVGACGTALPVGAVGSRHRGRWLPVELQWESGTSGYLAPSLAATKPELRSLGLCSEYNTPPFAHFVNTHW